MAQRDLNNLRQVTQVVARNPSTLVSGIAQVGEEIVRQSQEARINENLSKAQLELGALQNQYQIDYENDPMAGMEEYKQKRQEILETLGGDISPLFSRGWNDSVRKLTSQNDMTQQAWAYKQTRENTVTSINNSMKNNFMQARLDGQKLGEDDSVDVSAYLNYEDSKNQLAGWGNKNLGTAKTEDVLQNYGSDYVKELVSGVSETNPVKALKLLDDERVMGVFNDAAQYGAMKKAVESRALNVQEIMGQKEILAAMKDENSLLAKSIERPLSYSEIQQEMERTNMSPQSQKYFMKINGYSSDPSSSITQEDRVNQKAELYDMITQASTAENVTPDQLSGMQEKIYSAMNKKVLTQKEGLSFLNGMMEPIIANKENDLSQYQRGSWNPFQDNIGFNQLKPTLDQVMVPPPPDGKELGPIGRALNNENKVKMYDFYRDALEGEAASRNMKIGEIPNQDSSTKEKIYSRAADQAKRNFWISKYPEIGSAENVPPTIIDRNTGKKINTGLGDGKPVATVSAGNTKIATDKNGKRALVEIDKNGGVVRVIKEIK